MIQLKDIAITIMYLYIFVLAFINKEFAVSLILIFLGINYVILKNKYFNFDKKLKECLINQREAFVNILAHDLRIPAIAQIRALEIVKEEKLGTLNSTQKDMLVDIEDSCKCILNLMSLMINTYNMENNTYKFVYEKFNISDVIISCFDELLPQASARGITFEYKNEYRNLYIVGDKEELKKVILNILFSSIFNANIGRSVSVKINKKNKKIRFTVIADCENKLYTKTHVDTLYTSIGQNIRMGFCKKIIEIHKGRIINNHLKNSFSFELPQIVL